MLPRQIVTYNGFSSNSLTHCFNFKHKPYNSICQTYDKYYLGLSPDFQAASLEILMLEKYCHKRGNNLPLEREFVESKSVLLLLYYPGLVIAC